MNFKHVLFIMSFIMSLVISQSVILFGMDVKEAPIITINQPKEVSDGKPAQIDLPFLIALANSVQPQPEGIAACTDELIRKTKRKHFFEKLGKTSALHLYVDFEKTLDACISLIEKDLDDEKLWLGKKRDKVSSIDTFSPYVQKIDFPDGSKIYQWGDLHGGFHSLINELAFLHAQGIIDNNFRILHANVYFEFLGDFVDKGCFGVEVLYTLMRLKLANPKQVLLLRGNHEDISQNKLLGRNFGFAYELEIKMQNKDILDKINQFYDLLPVAQFVNRQLLCCHGGIDLSYINTDLLKCSEPFKCELLSDQNYNPTVLMSRLSNQARKNIATGLLGCAVEHLLTYMKSSAQNLFEGYKPIFREMGGCIGRNLQSDNKAYVSMREPYEKLCSEFDVIEREMKHAQLLQTFAVNDALVKYLQEFDKQITSVKEKVHALLAIFGTLVETQMLVEFPVLQAIHQTGAPILKSLESFDPAVLLQQLQTMMTKATRLQTSSSDLEKFKERLENYEEDAKGPGAKELERFRNWRAQCTEICTLEKDQKLTNFILELFTMQKREEFAGVAQQCEIEHQKLPVLFAPGSGVFNFYFLNNIGAKPKILGTIGFAWSDFCVDTKGPEYSEYSIESGRSVFGMLLAQEILKAQGIRVVIRAHQHYNPMYALILQSKGIACLWDFNNNREEFNLDKEGLICTMQIAHSSDMGRGVTYDAFGCLTVNGPDITKWTMKKINVPHCYGTIALKKQSSDS